jgi:DNA-binding MarR family transcriptional regulator
MVKRAREEARRQLLVERARATMEMRQLRHKFFNPAMFGEPAFDMLLALYVTNARPPIVSLRMLSPLIGVSQSSAVQWLKFLVSEGLAFSVGGDGDPGAIHAAITGKGRIVMGEYLKALEKIR